MILQCVQALGKWNIYVTTFTIKQQLPFDSSPFVSVRTNFKAEKITWTMNMLKWLNDIPIKTRATINQYSDL